MPVTLHRRRLDMEDKSSSGGDAGLLPSPWQALAVFPGSRSSGQLICDLLSPQNSLECASRGFSIPWPRPFLTWGGRGWRGFNLNLLLDQQICKPQVSSVSLGWEGKED